MERQFLTDLGLEKDVIDKVLNQHGAEMTAVKTQLGTRDTEVSTLRNDLIAANGKIAELGKVDVEGLQTQLDNEKAARKKDRQDWNIRAALVDAGCKDPDYVIFKLGGTIEFAEDGGLKDKDGLIEMCKTDYATQF